MRTQVQAVRDQEHRLFEAELSARLDALFRQCPALSGFAVQADGVVGELTCHPAVWGDQAELISEMIAEALAELAEERPDAASRLLGRTFARSLH